jgi:predicted Zn-dependent protease
MLSTLGRLDEAAGDRKGVPNFLSTHPEPLARVTEIRPTVEKLKAGRANWVTDRETLMRRMDGIVFGDNPEQGVTRGNTFLHPPLRFRIDFPNGWQVSNSAQQVVAQAPGADSVMVLQVAQGQKGSVEAVAAASMRQAGLQQVRGERSSINGLDAYLGVYQGEIEGLGPVVSRAAHIAHGGQIYVVAGLAPPAGFDRADATFLASIRTFRALSAAEAENIRPNRIDLYVVRSGDTWASLAERSGGAVMPASLAIMNGAAPNTTPQTGARIKIVVAG